MKITVDSLRSLDIWDLEVQKFMQAFGDSCEVNEASLVKLFEVGFDLEDWGHKVFGRRFAIRRNPLSSLREKQWVDAIALHTLRVTPVRQAYRQAVNTLREKADPFRDALNLVEKESTRILDVLAVELDREFQRGVVKVILELKDKVSP